MIHDIAQQFIDILQDAFICRTAALLAVSYYSGSLAQFKLIIQMDVLYRIKFGFIRSQMLASTLCVLREATLLGLVASSTFQSFFYTLFEIIGYSGSHSLYFLLFVLLAHLAVVLLPIIFAYLRVSSHPLLIAISCYFKIFPYMFFIALFNYCLNTALNDESLLSRVAALANLPFQLGFFLFHEFLNQSLKFREVDFSNRRVISYPGMLLMPLAIVALRVAGPSISVVVCVIRAFFELFSLYGQTEYLLPQKFRVFYALFTIYFSFLVVLQTSELISVSLMENPLNTLLIIVGGVVAAWLLTKAVVSFIWRNILASTRGEKSLEYSQDVPLISIQNQIKILVQSFIERERHLQGSPNNYQHFWQDFRETVFMHRLRCQQPRCVCRSRRRQEGEDRDAMVYLKELLKLVARGTELFGKQTRLKVLNIYMYIEIARKPFKGYYQLMLLKKEKLPNAIHLEVDNLVQIARECFDQIFFKNKVMNQQLDLLKVIAAEESISQLEGLVREAVSAQINFLEIFTYSNVKMAQVEAEAAKLKQLKSTIDKILEVLAVEYSEHPSVALSMYIFFKHLEVYRSREADLKKLSGQHALKKRLLVRAEGEGVSEQKGIVYCDLIEQRGRILKLTRNIPGYFGYAREEMVGFNINLFMPTLFGKYHGKFLSNFVDKGRIKLLKSKNRMVFGKNKKKFIFPITVQLKTEHLLGNQFGASALVVPTDTSSQFLIVGKNGKIQEITEGLYRRVFAKTLREQVWKVSRICAYKLLPALNQILQNWEENQPSKIYEGLLVFSQEEDYLQEKFRHARDASYSNMSFKTKTASLSLISNSSVSSEAGKARSENYQYFTELFKVFLADIEPKRLKAFKVSFKYSKIKTSEFEVEQVEVLSSRQELSGKDYLRELLGEFNTVAEIFQLNEVHSMVGNHLSGLEERVNADTDLRSGTLELKLNPSENPLHSLPMDGAAEAKDASFQSMENSEDELVQSNEKRGNQQLSDPSSLMGTTDSESKRLILINAFNTTERALPASAILCAFLASLLLFALLTAMAVLYFSSIESSESLWRESSYLLRLSSTFEFRLGIAEVLRFSSNANLSLLDQLSTQLGQLNVRMVELARSINFNTSNSDTSNGVFSFAMPIVDPLQQLSYAATFPQAVKQLSHYFLLQDRPSQDLLRFNYENLHTNLSNFYSQRYSYYGEHKQQFASTMVGLLAVYSAIIFLIALSSIPIFLYFKRQQESVRGKLAFMSLREIRKAVARLKLLHEAFRGFVAKGAVGRLQNEVAELKNEKEEELGVNKVIKLTSEQEGFKQLLCRPWIYCLLLAFVLFFSNLSAAFQLLLQSNNEYFLAALESDRLENQLSSKPPLLLNVYLSNLNRAMEGIAPYPFQPATLNQTNQGYFQLVTALAQPNQSANSISRTINASISNSICQSVRCPIPLTTSLQDIAQIFKLRFNYWHPVNRIPLSLSSIKEWTVRNNISAVLDQTSLVLALNLLIQDTIDGKFYSELKSWKVVGMWLAVILMPLNAVCLLVILRKYLNRVNEMVLSAQELFMHFPAQVLIENTYLTSYFNAKSKSGK